MGMNFPSSPSVGTLYPTTPTAGLPQYQWNGSAWVNVSMPTPDAPTDGVTYGRRNSAWVGVDYAGKASGRLTLVTGTPVMTANQPSKNTLFYTQYDGQFAPIFDGSVMRMLDIGGELSCLSTDASKNPAAIAASKVNDWFVWNDAGTFRLSHGPDWTNDTTRSAGSVLTRVRGILVNAVAITNGPAAQRGTFVGTVRSDGAALFSHLIGGSGSGGVAGFMPIWNMYNRKPANGVCVDSGSTYTYAGITIRNRRGSNSNVIYFMTGFGEDQILAHNTDSVSLAPVVGCYATYGIGLDTLSAYSNPRTSMQNVSTAVGINWGSASVLSCYPGPGLHFVAANEGADGTNATNYDSTANAELRVTLPQ